MTAPLRIGLLVEFSRSFGRRLLQGIAAYARTYGPWTFHHDESTFDDLDTSGLRGWKPDGIIARVSSPRLAQRLRRLGVPAVDLYEDHYLETVPLVSQNHCRVMQLAVEHFRECGLVHLAYTGLPNAAWSAIGARHFEVWASHWGLEPAIHFPPSSPKFRPLAEIEADAQRRGGELAHWLRELPKPVGVMACSDIRAQHVLAACAQEKIAVPDRVAILGADNDEVFCDLAYPSLSSVDPDAYQVGYQAAALLHRMIEGREERPADVLVDPRGVIRRASTDVLAYADEHFVRIMRYVREHACEGISVRRLASRLRLSRATLDRYFTAALGSSPRVEMTRVQVRRVEELLATTDLPLKQIARLAGFRHEETMYRVFHRTTGQTPGKYRRSIARQGGPE